MEWRASLLVKDLKVNARKTKLVVSRGGGGVVFELSAWPGGGRGVCSKGVAANSLQCSVYIHMRSLRLKGQVYMACIRTLLVVRVRDMGHDSRAGVKDGKDGDSGDQVDV